ncbi:ribosome small subunit-dependent GTPase A [Fusibacter bizertensis]
MKEIKNEEKSFKMNMDNIKEMIDVKGYTIDMNDYGFDAFFQNQWTKTYGENWNCDRIDQAVVPARVISDFGQMLKVVSPLGELKVNRPKEQQVLEQQVSAGDWLSIKFDESRTEATVEHVLDRKTKFSRAAAGIEVKEQIVAANVDVIFLIQSLNKDFNMRRLERYLIAAWESGANPVIVLTKSDLCDDIEGRIMEVEATAPGVNIFTISNLTGEGIDALKTFVTKGKTVALLGSSGVGKSTLVNKLAGRELLKTQSIREEDSKGRHTTTHRELVLLPEGGMILDTPGMRTLSLWEAEEGMEKLYGDIESLIQACRFSDCKHQNEPGCAVRAALRSGKLEEHKWLSWKKLQKEMRFLNAKKNSKLRAAEKQSYKRESKNSVLSHIDQY